MEVSLAFSSKNRSYCEMWMEARADIYDHIERLYNPRLSEFAILWEGVNTIGAALL